MRLPPARHFRGRFELPGDKSLSHRLALFGALAEGPTVLSGFSTAQDCASTLDCLARLGVALSRDGARVVLQGAGPGSLRAPGRDLDAGNSGSTLRMLAGVLAGRPFRTVLTGDASLRRRPMERVARPLRALGARVETTEGRPPLAIEGGPLRGTSWSLEVASAQVKTAVLLAGLQAEGRTTVIEPAPSRDHTERLLPLFGATVARDGLASTVEGGARLRGVAWEVPGDASSAAFFVVAALILEDSELRLDRVLLNPTRTAFLEVLREMGAELRWQAETLEPEPVGWIEARSSSLRGIAVDPRLVPSLVDEVPALAVAATRAIGRFEVSGAAELRVKESDRIAALGEGLAAMGADFEERPDGFALAGGRRLEGTRVRSHGDHRIAMALAVAALACSGPTEIEGAECASVSFPGFYERLAQGTRG